MKRTALYILLICAIAVPLLAGCTTTCQAPKCDYHFSGEVGL